MRPLERLVDRVRSIPPRWRFALAVVAVAIVGWLALMGRSRSPALDPSRPEVTPDLPAAGASPVSMVAVPISLPISRLSALLEDAVPQTYGDIDQKESLPGSDRTALAFHLDRAPFRVSMRGDTATITTTITYAVRVFYDPPVLPEMSGSCGTDDDASRPRLAVTLRAPVSLDREWRIRSDVRVGSIGPATSSDRDRCTVTFLSLDVTGKIVDAARNFLEDHANAIDSLAAGADLRSSFSEWWRTLEEPIHLTDSLWLAMRPESVRRGSIRGEGDSLEIALALRAHPTFLYGPRPEPAHQDLPPLDTGGVADGLDLRVEARADYAATSGLLSDQLAGKAIEHDGRRVQIRSVAVFGVGGGRLGVEVGVTGDVSGRLYLVGTPVIDPSTGRVSVPDLDFDVATLNVVAAAAAWLRADELRDLLRDKANWSAAPAVDFLSGWLVKGLNRDLSDDLRVQGTVEDVHILGVRATREALFVSVSATGTAELFVRTKSGA